MTGGASSRCRSTERSTAREACTHTTLCACAKKDTSTAIYYLEINAGHYSSRPEAKKGAVIVVGKGTQHARSLS